MNLLLMAELGRQIEFMSILLALAIGAGVALLLGICIVLISRVCAVEEDPRIKEVEKRLAGSNCGGCGFPGCGGLAKALVDGTAKLDACGQTTPANRAEISNILGLADGGATEPTIAVVGCAGGVNCDDKYSYQGYGDCISQNMLAGGRKACDSGCMGSGSCVDACPFSAIQCKEGFARVSPELCRSCGICIDTCPKSLIKRVPISAKVFIACSTNCRGKDVTSKCKVGCISCGICEKTCPSGAIHLENNVPVIDYSKCINCEECLKKCPRKIIRYVADVDFKPETAKPVTSTTAKPSNPE